MVTEGRRRERLDRGIKVRTERLYAVSGWQEIAYLVVPRLVLVLGLLILPLVMPSMYWQKVMVSMGVFGLLAMAFDFLAHYVGLVCLGGALFTGIGAYIAGILNSYFGLPLVLTIPIATLGGGLISTLLLLPCLPLRGIYFAIITIIFPLAVPRIITALNIWGGTEGMTVPAVLPNVWVELYLILGMILIVCFGLRRLVNEDYGLVLRGIKDNDQAVKASGINITLYKAQAVFITSAIGCFCGAFLVHQYGWCGQSLFALDFSILPIAATVLGGVGTLVGPLLGSCILIPLVEILRALGTLRITFYCIVLLAFIIFKPEGLMSWAQRKYHQFEHWEKV